MGDRYEHYSQELVEEGDRILEQADGTGTPILTVALEFLDFCEKNNLMYKDVLHSKFVLCHPKNRGSLGLNPYNCHLNLASVYRVGANPAELHGAVAIEISAKRGAKECEIRSNEQFVRLAGGLLAPLSGAERVLSVGCGHMAGACRAANAACRTSRGKRTPWPHASPPQPPKSFAVFHLSQRC